MQKKWLAIPLAAALSVGTLASGVSAFSDLKGVPSQEKIEQLYKNGIINGIGKGLFAPHKIITTEQAVLLIVKGLRLNLDHMKFIKKPEASDYFTNIPNNAWYASAFVTAYLNGVPLDKDVRAGTAVTREQFVNMLMNAVYTKGDYAWTEIYIDVKDGDQVTEGLMDPIQKALIAKIAKLDKEGKFRPLDPITRAEAAVMLHEAIRFVNEHEETPVPPNQPDDPVSDEKVDMTIQQVTDEIRKVTLDWGQKPNSGYGIEIVGIDFVGKEKAVVKYRLQSPEPGGFYAEVITEPKAEVYIGSNIKDVQLQQVK